MNKRTTLTLCALMICLSASSVFAGRLWVTDFAKAKATAKAANRYMLLDFSGSDWCGWCIKLDDEVFSTKAFGTYAKENLVCVLLDFPKSTSLSRKLEDQNQKLAQQYEVSGFPTVLVLSPKGDVIGRTGYKSGGPKNYVEHIKTFVDSHRKKHDVPAPKAIQKRQGKKNRSAFQLLKPLPRDENREVRTWTSKNGASINASVLEETGAHVILKKEEDGSSVKILKRSLSAEDQKYIKGLKTET